MGSYISRWKRKPSTVEVLEKLDKDITRLEKSKQTNTERQKRFIAYLIVSSVLIYIGSALVFYFYYMPTAWIDRIRYSLPLLFFPLLVWLLQRFLHWYYVKRIQQNDEALEKLKEKKKKILEDVMETETYKKAKEILEKFAPTAPPPSPQQTPRFSDRKTGEQVRQQVPQTPSPNMSTSMFSAPVATPMMTPAVQNLHVQRIPTQPPFATPARFRPPGPPMPRPVLPRERSVLDRLMEYLIGDGPQNRYALICAQCQSHNGMALREEFEYIGFRCCYCFYVNEARKQRPRAPSLETPNTNAALPESAENNVHKADEKADEDDVGSLPSVEETSTMDVDGETAQTVDDETNSAENDLGQPVDHDVATKDSASKKVD